MRVFALPLSLLLGLPVVAQADPMARFDRALGVLDGRASQQYEFSSRLRPGAEEEGADELPRYTGGYRGPWLEVARTAARRHDVPEDLFLRLVAQESAWDTDARSVAGAIGLAQLMPDTATLLGVDPFDPAENLEGGARYLAQQYRAFGTWALALAAYNAGPEAVRGHGGIPPYAETQSYVRVILAQD